MISDCTAWGVCVFGKFCICLNLFRNVFHFHFGWLLFYTVYKRSFVPWVVVHPNIFLAISVLCLCAPFDQLCSIFSLYAVVLSSIVKYRLYSHVWFCFIILMSICLSHGFVWLTLYTYVFRGGGEVWHRIIGWFVVAVKRFIVHLRSESYCILRLKNHTFVPIWKIRLDIWFEK